MSRRVRLVLWLLLTIAAGIASRKLVSPVPAGVKETGNVLWAMAAYAAIAAIWPKWGWRRVGAIALVLAWISELTQLVRHPALREARRWPVIGMLLGSGFSWVDMGMYVIGAVLAVTIDLAVIRRGAT